VVTRTREALLAGAEAARSLPEAEVEEDGAAATRERPVALAVTGAVVDAEGAAATRERPAAVVVAGAATLLAAPVTPAGRLPVPRSCTMPLP